MTDKEIRALIEKRRKEWRYGSSTEAKYKAEECDDILELLDSIQEEPVSEELEDVCEQLAENARKHKAETSSPFFSQTDYRQGVIDGAKWQKEKDESTTKDLGEYINELSKQFPEVSFAKLSRIAVRVAKWQMAQMIKDATDVTVHVDAGGYPYIPQMELYDYDKDIPLAKKGDKYNVVLIKED